MKNQPVSFSCPADLHDWLKEKGELEMRNLSNTIVFVLESVRQSEAKNSCHS